MFSFDWMKLYSVGIGELDRPHQVIMERLNELHEEMVDGNVNEAVSPLIRDLVSLAAEHFATEEKLMEATEFPGLADHRAKHREVSQKVGEFLARHEQGDKAAYSQIMYFLRNWITHYMQKDDRAYGPWLKDHGVR
jgi:hemerythrin-like metal-binding protein